MVIVFSKERNSNLIFQAIINHLFNIIAFNSKFILIKYFFFKMLENKKNTTFSNHYN